MIFLHSLVGHYIGGFSHVSMAMGGEILFKRISDMMFLPHPLLL